MMLALSIIIMRNCDLPSWFGSKTIGVPRVMDVANDQKAASLKGRWAVITGGSKGIGLGIAESFLQSGAHVVIAARGAEALFESVERLRTLAPDGAHVEGIVADTSSPDSIEEMFAKIDSLAPALDVFVANAGSGSVVPFLELSLQQWQQIIDLNLTGSFLCIQGAAQRMVAQSSGDGPTRRDRSILVVSSIRAVGARPGRVVYSATKAGVNQMVRVAAYELAPLGIRLNLLSPGITATPLALEGNPTVFAEMAEMVPMGRAGEIHDMGSAAAFLCSPAAGFITGANLTVDGGEALW